MEIILNLESSGMVYNYKCSMMRYYREPVHQVAQDLEAMVLRVDTNLRMIRRKVSRKAAIRLLVTWPLPGTRQLRLLETSERECPVSAPSECGTLHTGNCKVNHWRPFATFFADSANHFGENCSNIWLKL